MYFAKWKFKSFLTEDCSANLMPLIYTSLIYPPSGSVTNAIKYAQVL